MKQAKYFDRIREKAENMWQKLENDEDLAGPWHQLFKQVQNPRHVFSELLQNADDAKARKVRARIENDEFIFEHNGEDFSEGDFESLCRFGFSNKRNLHTIGFRGIGFKSTFSLGDEVRLITPTLSIVFKKNHFTEPIWEPGEHTQKLTQIRVFLKSASVKKQLEQNLAEWISHPLSILFFNHIKELTVGDLIVHRRKKRDGPVRNSEWVQLGDAEKPLLLVRSSLESFPEDAQKEIREERMGGEDFILPPCQVDIVVGADENRSFFIILPADVRTTLPFICNAPFIQDPARLQIKGPENSPTNKWLLERAGKLAASTMVKWLQRKDFSITERANAYCLFPNVDREDQSLEGACATVCEEAFESFLEDTNFLLTDSGKLVKRELCVMISQKFHEVWDPKPVPLVFSPNAKPFLCHSVTSEYRKILTDWGLLEEVDRASIAQTLSQNSLQKPPTWRQLLMLWFYISPEIEEYSISNKEVRIIPVQDNDSLYSLRDVVRLGEKRLLTSDRDSEFIAKFLRVASSRWFAFLEEQRAKIKTGAKNDVLRQQVSQANRLLGIFGLNKASETDHIFEQIANNLFSRNSRTQTDYIRIAHLAARWRVKTPDSFMYLMQDTTPRKPIDGITLADITHDLDTFFPEKWCKEHIINDSYEKFSSSCSRDDWRAWVMSGKSCLHAFPSPQKINEWHHTREGIQALFEKRGGKEQLYFQYSSDTFRTEDWDFPQEDWDYWKREAKKQSDFWARLLARMINGIRKPTKSFFWIKIVHRATNGWENTIAGEKEQAVAAWIVELRELPCLSDTHGIYREPAELYLRTSETEPLESIEPFVCTALDTEENRPLLKLLGVRDTPVNFDGLLNRIRSLASVDNPTPLIVTEICRWYGALDKMTSRCNPESLQDIQRIFREEQLILSADGTWSSSDVISLSENSVMPDVSIVHPAVIYLPLWKRVGVNEHPSLKHILDWLRRLESGKSFDTPESEHVRKALKLYPAESWAQCGHWLSLNSEWVPTNQFKYRFVMQDMTKWTDLFPQIRQQTADFQILSRDICARNPFPQLLDLHAVVKYRLKNVQQGTARPRREQWMVALGEGLQRVTMEDGAHTKHVRNVAKRLQQSLLQTFKTIEVVPCIAGTQQGRPQTSAVHWHETTLYVREGGLAKYYSAVVDRLAQPFDDNEITDAIRSCAGREMMFIEEYLENNFNMDEELSEDEINLPVNVVLADGKQVKPSDGQAKDLNPSDEYFGNLQPGSNNPEEQNMDVGGISEQPEGSIHPAGGKKIKPHQEETPLIDLFARENGYSWSAERNRYVHVNGSWLQKCSGCFNWERYNASGNIVYRYWISDQVLNDDGIEMFADLWEMISNHPDSSGIVARKRNSHFLSFSGSDLVKKVENEEYIMVSSRYRLRIAIDK